MNNNSIIFVTAFKDIDRSNWGKFKCTVDTYTSWFGNLCKMPIRLVCYCEDDVATILDSKFGFKNTYPYDTADTFFKYESREKEILESASYKELIAHRSDPECNKLGYNIVQHNKYSFLERTKRFLPGYSHYAWIDFGYVRDDAHIYSAFDFNKLENKIEIASFRNINVADIVDPVKLCVNPSTNPMQGGVIIIPSKDVEWMLETYSNMVLRYYELNLVDDDQALLLQLYKSNPERFTLYITPRWFDLLTKYKVNLYIDLVIPTCEKDISTLPLVIKGARKNITGLRNIYVVCNTSIKDKIQDAIFIDEANYPFTIQDVAQIRFNNKDHTGAARNGPGWYYQQLLKLYSFAVIPGLSIHHLIIDSETIFYNPYTPVINNIAYYAVSNEVRNNYRTHMKLLLPDIQIKYSNISGICHQMLFQTHVLLNLFDRVCASYKQTTNVSEPFWKIMLLVMVNNNLSEYSEYDIYFNFILAFHSWSVKLSTGITWDITGIIPETSDLIYLTAHAHLRSWNIYRDQYKVKELPAT